MDIFEVVENQLIQNFNFDRATLSDTTSSCHTSPDNPNPLDLLSRQGFACQVPFHSTRAALIDSCGPYEGAPARAQVDSKHQSDFRQ